MSTILHGVWRLSSFIFHFAWKHCTIYTIYIISQSVGRSLKKVQPIAGLLRFQRTELQSFLEHHRIGMYSFSHSRLPSLCPVPHNYSNPNVAFLFRPTETTGFSAKLRNLTFLKIQFFTRLITPSSMCSETRLNNSFHFQRVKTQNTIICIF